uniref:Uncharacterized protein n=1 Tax=Arion vulgaris TaxID=1028688 RepID=A0A0B7AIE3_9EUPU
MYGLIASPRACDKRIWTDSAKDRRVGMTTYNNISAVTAQFKHNKTSPTKIRSQVTPML